MSLLSFIKNNRSAIFATVVLVVLILVDCYKCPVYALFGIPCPTCGVTRALLSLAKLDFNAYIEYNAMAAFLLTAIAVMLYRSNAKNRLAADIYIYLVLALNTVYYIVRLIF